MTLQIMFRARTETLLHALPNLVLGSFADLQGVLVLLHARYYEGHIFPGVPRKPLTHRIEFRSPSRDHITTSTLVDIAISYFEAAATILRDCILQVISSVFYLWVGDCGRVELLVYGGVALRAIRAACTRGSYFHGVKIRSQQCPTYIFKEGPIGSHPSLL